MQIDFGTLALGTTLSRPATIPLVLRIDELPAGQIIYSGGSSSIDLVLSSLGLGLPLTAGALAQRYPGLQATYSIRAVATAGPNAAEFSCQAGNCIGNTSASCTAKVSFKPIALGKRQAIVSPAVENISLGGGGVATQLASAVAGMFAAPISAQLVFAVIGTAQAPAIVVPSSLDFGGVEYARQGGPLAFEIVSQSTVPISLGIVKIAGPNAAAFALVADAISRQTLPPGGRLKATVVMVPTIRGATTGAVQIAHDAPLGPMTVALAGKGLAPVVVITPSALDFGDVAAGAVCAERVLTIRNDGDAPLRVSAISTNGPDAASFVLADNTCVNAPVLPGGVAQIALCFAPPAMGRRRASLALRSNEVAPPASIEVAGNGTPAARLQVFLHADQWQAAAGAALTYTVTARNNGPHTAVGVAVVVRLPESASFVSASKPCQAPPVAATGRLFWNVGNLAVGASATLDITVKITTVAQSALRAGASIRAATADPFGAWTSAKVVTAVQ
jgi:uncharacterized repeat protein (TIGR01451 family)